MLLEHDPSIPITEEVFLRVFEKSSPSLEFNREKLADLMYKYEKRLVFTDNVRKAIDHVYQNTSEAPQKKRCYGLRAPDEDGIEHVDNIMTEKTPETSVERSQKRQRRQNL